MRGTFCTPEAEGHPRARATVRVDLPRGAPHASSRTAVIRTLVPSASLALPLAHHPCRAPRASRERCAMRPEFSAPRCLKMMGGFQPSTLRMAPQISECVAHRGGVGPAARRPSRRPTPARRGPRARRRPCTAGCASAARVTMGRFRPSCFYPTSSPTTVHVGTFRTPVRASL
jgi:hypothetical protein